MKLRPASTIIHTKTTDSNEHTLSLSSKKQLLKQLHSEQQEVKGITQQLLETEAGFIKDLDHYLTQRDALELRKRKLLHKRWTQSVWLPIQQSIQQHFKHSGYSGIQRMRSMHDYYIYYCNAKGFVFLDTFDPLEYNPFLHHFNTPHYHKIITPPLEDPLFLQSQARIKEKAAILRCQTGHVYRCQQVEDLLRSSLHRDFARTTDQVFRSRVTPCMALTEGRRFHTQCCFSH